MVLKDQQKKKMLGQNLEKNLLKNRLSICVRNFALLNEPQNIFLNFFYFNPEVAHMERLYGVKIRKV
jgi:hypothetical protein